MQNRKDVLLFRVFALKKLLASAERIYLIFIHAWLNSSFSQTFTVCSLQTFLLNLWINVQVYRYCRKYYYLLASGAHYHRSFLYAEMVFLFSLAARAYHIKLQLYSEITSD